MVLPIFTTLNAEEPDFVAAIEALNKKEVTFAISYDGRSGNKIFGKLLPQHLNLQRIELEVGRSSQATLLGKTEMTVESLYLSSSLLENFAHTPTSDRCDSSKKFKQLTIF